MYIVLTGWMILTGTEIVVSFFILLLYMLNRTDKKVSSDNDCNDFINHDLYNSSEEKPWEPEFI